MRGNQNSEKDRQHNDKKKKNMRTNNDLQNTNTNPLKTGVNSGPSHGGGRKTFEVMTST